MITALCLNPCVDKTISIERFVYAGMNRIVDRREVGSGKGVNVALAAAALGEEAACVGLLPRQGGEAVELRLKQAGVAAGFLPVEGRLRVNTKVLDLSTAQVTELNEPGTPVDASLGERLMALCLSHAAKSRAFVLTGSVPKGIPAGFYAGLGRAIKEQAPKARVVLDAEGELFAAGLQCRPFMAKPNRLELETLLGRPVTTLDDARLGAGELLRRGVEIAVVTLGGDGAYATDGKKAFFAPALDVCVRGTVGAGDCMLAAMTLGFTRGLGLEQAFARGVAAAASCVASGEALVNPQTYPAYLRQVVLEEIEP